MTIRLNGAITLALAGVLALGSASAQAADTAKAMYTRAQADEQAVRSDPSHATLAEMHRAIAAYEAIVRRHPSSGYCDNALWQAAGLAQLAHDRFGSDADQVKAQRLLAMLAKEYPTSKLAAKARTQLATVTAALADQAAPPSSISEVAEPVSAPPAPATPATRRPTTASRLIAKDVPATDGVVSPKEIATLKEIHRTILPDGVRLTVDLDGEVSFHQEEITNPRRLFFDLKGVRTVASLQDVSLKFNDDIVKEVRLGRHPQNTTRLVVDLEGVGGYTVYPLYGPYRLVIDLRRGTAAGSSGTTAAAATPTSAPTGPAASPAQPIRSTPPPAAEPALPWTDAPVTALSASAPGTRVDPQPVALRAPAAPAGNTDGKGTTSKTVPSVGAVAPNTLPPAANLNGKFSLSRQLGLSVSRIVIDAGHGGHDPGAQGNGINEAELTLDVALRVQKLLQKQPGIEVVMTRDTDVFIPLQERTAIANREGADLFLSIHANASRNPQAHGIETYFLNFAVNPEAEAVAARENATSAESMHALPDIVHAIALNNKINESRDFAASVQRSMTHKLASKNKSLRDLGVKQAPFVVLIGASMPSVLAEISFVTNKQDGSLLKTNAYRQQIAQALYEAVVNYQQSLKKANALTAKKATIEQ